MNDDLSQAAAGQPDLVQRYRPLTMQADPAPAVASKPEVQPEVQAQAFAEDVAMAEEGFLTTPSETLYVNNLNENVKLPGA